MKAKLLRGENTGAADAARRLAEAARTEEEQRRAAALLGRALVRLGEAEQADSLLSYGIAGRLPEEERVEALAARGAARRALAQWDAADADYAAALRLRSDDPGLRLARFHLLLAAGKSDAAALEFRWLLSRSQRPPVEEAILAAADSFALLSPAAARDALARASAGPLRNSTRAKLVTLRGRLTLAAGDADSARADYERASAIAPKTDGAVAGYVALARLELSLARSLDDLGLVRSVLSRATATGVGRGMLDVRSLSSGLDGVTRMAEAGDVVLFAAAERARDDLQAPYLARALFLQFADEWTNTVWAPKAILAALALGPYHYGAPPDPSDEALRERLRSDYPQNPYATAVLGTEESPQAFAAAERALEQRMRVMLARLGVAGARRPESIVEDTVEEIRGRRPRPQGPPP